MGAALVLLLVGLGAMAAGVLIGRYYVPDDRQLRRTARHSRAYMRALSDLVARDHEAAIGELRAVVEENIEDVEPYFALAALFRSRGEHERAVRVHQALALRERDHRKLRQRALHELGLDFRAAGMPRRATRAMEEVLLEEPAHEGALRVLAALYEEQARYVDAAGIWQRLGRGGGEDTNDREHHLLVAAAQAALGGGDPDGARQLLKAAQKHGESAHFHATAAELAAARGNHRGAKERLKQALVADPALAPHLVPGLIAAEQGLAERSAAATGAAAGAEADAETTVDAAGEPAGALPAAATPGALPAGASAGEAGREPSTALATQPATAVAAAPGSAAGTAPGTSRIGPADRPHAAVAERVLATLAEVEALTGPRLELLLIRAELVAALAPEAAAHVDLVRELTTSFPEALAARVATARHALATGDDRAIRRSLEALAGEGGAIAWALHGRWQCGHCAHRPGAFAWRCGQCRRWATLRMETGVEPPPAPPRERRERPRPARAEGAPALLGATPDDALPPPTLAAALDDELAGPRRSVLGRAGSWFSAVLRRTP